MNAVRMPAGQRVHRSASLRIGETEAVPEHMRWGVREVSSLQTPPEDQRKGYATSLLHQVTAEADRAGMVLIILPAPYEVATGAPDADELAALRLEAFYERFGFRKIQATPVIMARQPERNRIVMHAVHKAMQ